MPAHVREWVTHLQAEEVSAATIQKVRFILCGLMPRAVELCARATSLEHGSGLVPAAV
jgi:hypothetical protein